MKFLASSMAIFLAMAADAAQVFNVRDFGAKGDGKTLDTVAIQKALDECGKSGGIVEFPPGVYLSKPVYIKGSKTTLQLDADAKLIGTDEPGDYRRSETGNNPPRSGAFIALINAKNLTDITITGHGTIDGAGARWWVPAQAAREKTPGYSMPRPKLILISNSQNVRLQDITLQNSPSYHFAPVDCENVVISNVTILAPSNSPNTDAIDPGNCKNVLITKCRIDVGDDNVAIKAGHKVPGREFACEDITVTDCIFLHGHGMSIGSETSGGVHNVTVSHCVFQETENGIRIKSQRGKGGLVENINYSDLVMSNVDPAITFTCYYSNNSAKDPVQKPVPENDNPQPKGQGTPVFRDIHLSNLTATCQGIAGIITGLPESQISGLTFQNVRIASATGFQIQNASDLHFRDVTVAAQTGKPFLLKNAQIEGIEK